jgi:hypothetical protein
MRTIVIAAAGALAIGLTGQAAAKDLTLTRRAASGVDSRIAYERAWDQSCNAVPTAVTVTAPPKSGTISVVQGTSTIPENTPNSGATADNCVGKSVVGNEVRYQSSVGFHGIDTVTYSVTRDGKPDGTRVITIEVK